MISDKLNNTELKEKELINYYSSEEKIKILSERMAKIFNFDLIGLKYIERGGGSFIYLADIKERKNSLIVKVINEEKCKNLREVTIMSQLRHKNIISMYGYYFAKNSELFILMERGKMDLKNFPIKLLKRAVLSESFLCFTAYQILEGLKYLYKCKIIHYDIKPNNIVIDDMLNVKIIDFSTSVGISQIKEPYIKLKYRGTSFYMAPEVIKRQEIEIKNFHKIDLFSLGVTLYRLAFGCYPFDLKREDMDNDDIIYNKINSDWKVKNEETEFSNYFIDFLNCLLEKDINKRINIDEAMNHYWVQGGKILFEEKENISNANIFLTSLITDHFLTFNKYLN